MELQRLSSTELSWQLDFKPLRQWPGLMPVLASPQGSELAVVAGFERRSDAFLDVLVFKDIPAVTAITELWPLPLLKNLEKLRLEKCLQMPAIEDYLLQLPLDLQNYLDLKDLPLKTLRPLRYLVNGFDLITKWVTTLKPSSSQVREILDVLCDLSLQGKVLSDIGPGPLPTASEQLGALRHKILEEWLRDLGRMRTPRAFEHDTEAGHALEKIPWPRGMKARWQRQGDQSGIVIQTMVTNNTEWLRLKSSIEKLHLGETLWKSN